MAGSSAFLEWYFRCGRPCDAFRLGGRGLRRLIQRYFFLYATGSMLARILWSCERGKWTSLSLSQRICVANARQPVNRFLQCRDSNVDVSPYSRLRCCSGLQFGAGRVPEVKFSIQTPLHFCHFHRLPTAHFTSTTHSPTTRPPFSTLPTHQLSTSLPRVVAAIPRRCNALLQAIFSWSSEEDELTLCFCRG